MSRVFHYAEDHGLGEPGQSNPAAQAKLGTKRCTYERRILTLEETSRVLTRLDDPNLLIIETCIATGRSDLGGAGPQMETRQLQYFDDPDRTTIVAPGTGSNQV